METQKNKYLKMLASESKKYKSLLSALKEFEMDLREDDMVEPILPNKKQEIQDAINLLSNICKGSLYLIESETEITIAEEEQ